MPAYLHLHEQTKEGAGHETICKTCKREAATDGACFFRMQRRRRLALPILAHSCCCLWCLMLFPHLPLGLSTLASFLLLRFHRASSHTTRLLFFLTIFLLFLFLFLFLFRIIVSCATSHCSLCTEYDKYEQSVVPSPLSARRTPVFVLVPSQFAILNKYSVQVLARWVAGLRSGPSSSFLFPLSQHPCPNPAHFSLARSFSLAHVP